MLRALIDDLDTAVQAGSQEKRVEILRHVTDLFLGSADNINNQQVDLFGDVLAHLTKQVESKALAELGAKLAPVDNAPNAVIQSLARHHEIAVAGPVLARSSRLTDLDLVEIAKAKGQEHLAAISERTRLAEVVTDILVERGDTAVVRKLSQNQGAAFSIGGFTSLAKRAQSDEHLAENLGGRLDLPPQLIQDLVSKASEQVRTRLMASAPPDVRPAIQDVLASISNKVLRETITFRDFRSAEALVAKMQGSGELNEAAIVEFANAGKYEEIVAGLARLCSAPLELIERLMENIRYDGLLVACKSAELHWPTFRTILKKRFSHHQISDADVENARLDFLKLSVATARRMFRFWLVRGLAKAGG
jgi:uncharacterized protein (DUF2336 family)